MAEEKQKYSLISLDTGEEPVETTEVEERAGVTTTTQVVDGEETIRVSSAGRTAATADAGVSAEGLSEAADEQAPMRDARHGEEPAQEEVPTHASDASDTSDAPEDEEPVPYRRMQSVIVLCLIVLIAVFLVYFNFFR